MVRESFAWHFALATFDVQAQFAGIVTRGISTRLGQAKLELMRNRMLNIPDRVAAMMAAEIDAAKCFEILDVEIREALTGVADSFSEGDRLSGDDRDTAGPVS